MSLEYAEEELVVVVLRRLNRHGPDCWPAQELHGSVEGIPEAHEVWQEEWNCCIACNNTHPCGH